MKTINITKKFNGIVSVRDYVVEGCIKKKEALVISHEGQLMTLSVEDLKSKRFQITRKEIPSKYKGSYFLYDYKFVSDSDKSMETLF